MRKGSLVICCGTQSVFTWSDEWVGEGGDEEDMAECIGVPSSSEWSDSRWELRFTGWSQRSTKRGMCGGRLTGKEWC
jgi:hypothetical protein